MAEKKSDAVYQDVDFSQLYLNHMRRAGRVTKPASSWDEKAEKMARVCANPEDEYLKAFLSRMDLSGAETLLDVGCGPGTICLLCAPRLRQVYGLDYSPGMLDAACRRANEAGIVNAAFIQREWDAAWDDVPVCDIVVASRSTLVADMASALRKLNEKARMRVYTTHAVQSHFIDERILSALERQSDGLPNYIYPLNILYQMGIHPRLDYIDAHYPQPQPESYEALERAVGWSLGELSLTEKRRLKSYYRRCEEDDVAPLSSLRRWAFISWQTQGGK
ncbi:class I SAM-dependent methyltransferase [Leminorella grimontii]|uniref:class I SAM-dependent methyltransferase n=1 Tax=Leminorella grimontii TaxID=82981 RepID=UPI0032202F26